MRNGLARAALTVAVLAAVTTSAPGASGQSDPAGAEVLFREGRRLMDEGRIPDACRKFEESQRLGPAGGTLLNLGVCHEKEGRLATAWGELTQALAMARRDGNEAREAFAKERLAELERALPRLSIEVPEASRVRGLAITRNELPASEGAWGTALPVDPGPWTIQATAPGRKPWRTTVDMKRGARVNVVVPLLEPDGAAAPAPPPPVASASSPRPTPPAETSAPAGSAGRAAPGARRTAAYVSLGASAVSLALGTYFGLSALSKRSQSDDECPIVKGTERCTARGAELNDDAYRQARVANVAFVIGAAAGIAGGVLLVTSSGEQRAALSVGPTGASLSGRFLATSPLREAGKSPLATTLRRPKLSDTAPTAPLGSATTVSLSVRCVERTGSGLPRKMWLVQRLVPPP